MDEEDLTLVHGEDFSWFRRSVHFLLFFIGVAAILLLVMLVLPRRFSNANFENGFGVRIPIDLRRLEAEKQAEHRLYSRVKMTTKRIKVVESQKSTTKESENGRLVLIKGGEKIRESLL